MDAPSVKITDRNIDINKKSKKEKKNNSRKNKVQKQKLVANNVLTCKNVYINKKV